MQDSPSRFYSDDPQSEVSRFTVAGISLRRAFKTLRPAFPKRGQVATAIVVMTATPRKVIIGMVGAEFGMPAIASGSFSYEMAWREFRLIKDETFEDGELITFDLAPGHISLLGVTSKSPSVKPRATSQSTATTAGVELGAPTDPMDAPVGLPLLAVFAHMRRYGKQPSATPEFMTQQQEVEHALNVSGSVLAKLGLGREDIENLIERRMGLS